jgi:hypothetical protein
LPVPRLEDRLIPAPLRGSVADIVPTCPRQPSRLEDADVEIGPSWMQI